MNILVTLDKRYLPPLHVMLTSLFLNNPGEHFEIYLASDDLSEENLSDTRLLCTHFEAHLHPIRIGAEWFCDAPTVRYYSRAMYYRLLAAQFLPGDLDRILYLDPDMLVINPIRTLYETELGDHLYAACIHSGVVNLSKPINQVRLSSYESDGYYNSGMLLMNLPAIRREVHADEIYDYAKRNRNLLILPDQDILNGLYGLKILTVDDSLWNYDSRKYNEYRLASSGKMDMNWVMAHTAILHYCGKHKPWHKSSFGRFTALYKHYMRVCERYIRYFSGQMPDIHECIRSSAR